MTPEERADLQHHMRNGILKVFYSLKRAMNDLKELEDTFNRAMKGEDDEGPGQV